MHVGLAVVCVIVAQWRLGVRDGVADSERQRQRQQLQVAMVGLLTVEAGRVLPTHRSPPATRPPAGRPTDAKK